ncbi:RNA polymerase sigma factor [Timonella senegalensis]|uniref:RNA polymerase sigma factor n=1 Tax=Timonella senegalensis TaxID=1465825 RepID=UPI00030AC3CA|nr:RNA polymerase sigma factor [Timonella senegalensis]
MDAGQIPEPLEAEGGRVIELRPGNDDAWFADLFSDYAMLINRYIYRRTSSQDVEDLTAETFATAWRKRGEIPREFALQWLYRTAGFLVANHNRKNRPTLLENFPDVASDADPAAAVIEDVVLRQAFYALSERDRQVLLLAAWEGLNAEDIARVLEVSPGAAAVALSRARTRLAASFAEVSADGNDAARSQFS